MKAIIGFLAILLLVGSCREHRQGPGGTTPVVPAVPEIELVDATASSGLERYSKTFGVAVTDLDNDGRDDLVISNHGQIPSVYLNRDGYFEDHSHLLPDQMAADRHGVTAVDLDNDGDRDLIFAGGGSDGIGPGHINRLYRSRLADSGRLVFDSISGQTGISYPPWRARHFLPLANRDGSLVDLYCVCLSRENCPNLYFSNRSGGEIQLLVDESPGLNRSYHTEGRDLFFDYDRDGDPDLLLISRGRPMFLERVAGRYELNDSVLPGISQVACAGVGDLDNDGLLDIYFGGQAGYSRSDRISFNSREIHFVVRTHDNDPGERLLFDTGCASIAIDFVQHVPGHTIRDPANIFVGQRRRNPPAREAVITAEMAEGEPLRQEPGIYIWKDTRSVRWSVEWVYNGEEREDKGKITADSVDNVREEDLETLPERETRDRILINRGGRLFEELAGLDLSHHRVTRAVAVCDLNNDGLPEIIGIRGAEPGLYNGDPFVLVNRGDLRFTFRAMMQNEEDDIFQADQLVWGFFNDDGLPDLFITNGYGLNPGFNGPYKLFLNRTPEAGNFVILVLQGRTANRDAVGAEVELRSQQGKLLGYRQLGAGFNRSQSSRKLHFGLGRFSGEAVALVRWPGTSAWERRVVGVNKITIIEQ